MDLEPADGQYPDDAHPKYPQQFPKPKVGGGYTAHGYHVWSNRGADGRRAVGSLGRRLVSFVWRVANELC